MPARLSLMAATALLTESDMVSVSKGRRRDCLRDDDVVERDAVRRTDGGRGRQRFVHGRVDAHVRDEAREPDRAAVRILDLVDVTRPVLPGLDEAGGGAVRGKTRTEEDVDVDFPG